MADAASHLQIRLSSCYVDALAEHPVKEYDDEHVLTNYVWDHFARFLTPAESKAGLAVFAEAKRAVGASVFAEFIWRKHKLAEDSAVAAELADGTEAFRRRAAARIVREHASEIFVNRCPRCHRVVRTPKAQQCLWCGHDWHQPHADGAGE
jgi:hypothetical protein